MRRILFVTAVLGSAIVAACEAAPQEQAAIDEVIAEAEAPADASPVAPAVVCEDPAVESTCSDYEEEVKVDPTTDAEAAAN